MLMTFCETCASQMEEAGWKRMRFQSNTFSCIFILSFPGPGLPRVGQPCAAINKIGRCHRQAHHLTGAAQGREGRRADWQHEPGRSKRTSPAQAANRPDASRNRHHPTLSPTTPAFAARPISRLLLPMRKRASLPPVHAWLPSIAPEHV